jgi:hypothetical protein
MIRPHAQGESIHALHAKARARMLMLAQGCESSGLLLSRVCSICGLPLTRSLTHTAPSHHDSNHQNVNTRHLRFRTLSTNLYIVNPEPETLKPKDYARTG